MKKLLTNYTVYNLWANERICKKASLDLSLLDLETKSSFNTVRKTLLHIWDAETIWYKRLKDESLRTWPAENYDGSFDEFSKEFLNGSDLFCRFVAGKNEEELSEVLKYKSLSGVDFATPISDIILHCMNHSTFHRGQIYTMMRTVGITELQSIDYITFTREN